MKEKEQKKYNKKVKSSKRALTGSKKSNLKEVRKDSIFRFVTDWVFNKTTKGKFEVQTSDFQISFDKILSETGRKVVYHILDFPENVTIGHLEKLRVELRDILPEDMKDTFDLHVIQLIKNNKMSVTDKKITRQRTNVNRKCANLEKDIALQKQRFENGIFDSRVSEYSVQLAEDNLRKWKRKRDSYETVIRHKRQKKSYNRTYIFIELVCPTVEELEIASEGLEGLLQTGIDESPYVYKQIDIDLDEYIKQFGIISLVPESRKKDLFVSMDLTSNVNAISEAFIPGVVRSKYPEIYLGHRISNGYPYFTHMKATSDASNILLLAMSGSGKTTEIINMLLWMLDNVNLNLIVNDIKGHEYDLLIRLLDPKTVGYLSFSLENSCIANTFRIIDYKLLGYKTPRQAYTLCSQITSDSLVCLIDPPEHLRSEIEALCSEIVRQVYINHGVYAKEPDTYDKAKDIIFGSDVWTALCGLTAIESSKASRKDDDFFRNFSNDALNFARNKLQDYFFVGGSKTSYFIKEIPVEDLLKKRLLVIDHGRNSAGGVAKTPAEQRFTYMQKHYISTLTTAINHKNGKLTTEVVEEVAQLFEDPYMIQMISDDITGLRSLGKTNILITNSVSPLVNPKVNINRMNSIKVNLTRFLIGKCEMTDAQQFMQLINRAELEESIIDVTQQVNPDYRHAFMYIDTTEEVKPVIVKAMLTDEILENVVATDGANYDGLLM